MNPNQLVPERTNAIPCQYKGINFRSLLEARWAYFFDKLGWDWEYEPFEMDGYIPDFLVTYSEDCRFMVVDVKPFFTLDYQKNVIKKCKLHCQNSVLLFASTPSIKIYNTPINTSNNCTIEIKYYKIGEYFLLDETPILDCCVNNISENRTFWPDEIFFNDYLRKEAVKAKMLQEGDFEPPFQYYTDLITDGKLTSYLWRADTMIAVNCSDYNAMIGQLESYWAEAQNATQYKPKTPQQFIQESTQDSKESGLEIILPFGTKYSK